MKSCARLACPICGATGRVVPAGMQRATYRHLKKMSRGGTPIDWCCPDCPQRGITDFVDMDTNRHPKNNDATTLDEERRPEEPTIGEDTTPDDLPEDTDATTIDEERRPEEPVMDEDTTPDDLPEDTDATTIDEERRPEEPVMDEDTIPNDLPENNDATTIDEERRPEEPVMDEDTTPDDLPEDTDATTIDEERRPEEPAMDEDTTPDDLPENTDATTIDEERRPEEPVMDEDVIPDNLAEDRPMQFTIVEDETQRGKGRLHDSWGFRYTKKKDTKSGAYWVCSVRSAYGKCYATVIQRGDTFCMGRHPHTHEAPASTLLRTKIRVAVKRRAREEDSSGRQIAEEVIEDQRKPDSHSLLRPDVEARAANRERARER